MSKATLPLVAALASTMGAQSPTGEIAGIVRANEAKKVHTGSQGQYSFPRLAVGVYRLRVRQAGFRTSDRKDVERSAPRNPRVL